MNNGFEWEEAYARMVDELPTETIPSAMLEERTVRELRNRGLLRRRRWLPTSWLVGSVAASLALFASGVAVGQWMGTRTVAELAQSNSTSAAAQVQETGTAYVRALEALVSAANQTQGAQQSAQAREVALTALHAAANEVVRLAPNDPVATKILQGIEQAKRQTPLNERDASGRQIVWF